MAHTVPTGWLTRDLIALDGPDTISLLQGLITQNLTGMTAGEVRHAALLTPQGKILDTMMVWQTPTGVLLDVAAGRGAPLMQRLKLYRLRAQVEIAPREDVAVWVGEAQGAQIITEDPRHPALGRRAIAPAVAADASSPIDAAYGAVEVQFGIPAFGTAYGEGDAFPLGVNLDLLHGIDHHKGCFVGQEVASRMYRKGDIRKRTWHVRGAGLSPCQKLKLGARAVADVTAVMGEEGLAIVRLDLIEGKTPQDVTTPEGTTVTLTKPEYLP